MIIIRLMGGLGNQMQQYALYKKFISKGRDAYLDTTWFSSRIQDKMKAPRALELDRFENVSYKTADSGQIRALTGGDGIAGRIRRRLFHSVFTEEEMYYPDLIKKDNAYLEGYWACEKYYSDILDELKADFSFNPGLMSDEAREMAERIKAESLSVSVHIRRGDYLDPENMKLFGNIATEKYYDSAFEYIRKKMPGAHFFIFSDDPAYVNDQYADEADCTMADVNRGDMSMYDIYLMSLCTAHICANSTFSFWGARLDGNPGFTSKGAAEQNADALPCIRIRPTKQKNTQIFDPGIMRDLWRGWTFIDPSGRIYEP